MFQATSIQKVIGTSTYVDDVSLTCRPGEAVCLMGPNGAGKSLLLKALTLVDPATRGEIQVDARRFQFPESSAGNPSPPWPDVTFVFQQLFLWPHLTVKANIALPAIGAGVNADRANREANGLAERLGIADTLGRYPNEVSGGQRQRAALARALNAKPKWLFLDEPNAALDVEQNQLLRSLLAELKQQGVGIVFSTHLAGFAAALADHIVFLDGGRVVEEGSSDILINPTTDRLRRFLDMIEFSRTGDRTPELHRKN